MALDEAWCLVLVGDEGQMKANGIFGRRHEVEAATLEVLGGRGSSCGTSRCYMRMKGR